MYFILKRHLIFGFMLHMVCLKTKYVVCQIFERKINEWFHFDLLVISEFKVYFNIKGVSNLFFRVVIDFTIQTFTKGNTNSCIIYKWFLFTVKYYFQLFNKICNYSCWIFEYDQLWNLFCTVLIFDIAVLFF